MTVKTLMTERDIEILQFINRFGFCQMPHICRRFKLGKTRHYQVMSRLIKSGYVHHEFIFHRQHGVYRVSKAGAALTNLRALKSVPTAIFDHETTLINLYLMLTEKYPEMVWVSERELIADKYAKGVGTKGHIADGLMIFPDKRIIAIELELTFKGRGRSASIFKEYSKDFDIHEVWYFCTDKVAHALRDLAAKTPVIKLHLLKEWLYAES